eukprot:GHVP01011640.1.p1 GENE.GHVP01011640.1~~GHVP01011640.1.p1  ORF type:complete len:420 (+),score=92.28 GHVP01011640.1:17-1276(+)
MSTLPTDDKKNKWRRVDKRKEQSKNTEGFISFEKPKRDNRNNGSQPSHSIPHPNALAALAHIPLTHLAFASQQNMGQISPASYPSLIPFLNSALGYNPDPNVFGGYIQPGRQVRNQRKEGEGSPSRVLFLRNMSYDVTADEIRPNFSEVGDVKNISLDLIHKGIVFVTYYDIRDAIQGFIRLKNKIVKGRAMDVHYSRAGDRDERTKCDETKNQGTLYLRLEGRGNIDKEGVHMLAQKYGEIQEIRGTRNNDKVFFVEFFDSRSCKKACDGMSEMSVGNGVLHVEYAWDHSRSFLQGEKKKRGINERDRSREGKSDNDNPRTSKRKDSRYFSSSEDLEKEERGERYRRKRMEEGKTVVLERCQSEESVKAEEKNDRRTEEKEELVDKINKAIEDPSLLGDLESIMGFLSSDGEDSDKAE